MAEPRKSKFSDFLVKCPFIFTVSFPKGNVFGSVKFDGAGMDEMLKSFLRGNRYVSTGWGKSRSAVVRM